MRQFALGRWWIVIGVMAVGVVAVVALRPRQLPSAQTLPARANVNANAKYDSIPSAVAPSVSAPALPDSAPAAASAEVDPYGMPPPSPEQIRPVPAPPVVTAQEHQATRQAARELVERGIVRLLREGQQAAQRGDAETAQRNQLRVVRLRQRLAALTLEAAPVREEK